MKVKIIIIHMLIMIFIFSGFAFSNNGSADVGQGQCARSNITSNTTWFNDRGIDQPENWINQPSSMRFGIYTYVVWQGGTGFLPCIERFNHVTNSWEPSYQLASSNPIAGDGHGAPNIFITTSGKILITYGAHMSALKYIRGDVNQYPNGFVAMTDITSLATYPHFIFVPGSTNRIFLFYRAGGACSTWADRTSNDNGLTWSVESSLGPGTGGVYIGGITAGEDGYSIFMEITAITTCAVTDSPRQDAYVVYYLPDFGNAFWCKTVVTDTQIGFTIPSPIPAVCRIESSTYANFGQVRKIGTAIQGGNVFVEYLIGDNFPKGTWQTRFAYWNGTAWILSTALYNDYFQDYADFRLITNNNIDLYGVANATDYNNSVEGGILNRYNWNGLSWTFVNTILSPSNSSGNLLSSPFVPMNGNDEIYFQERIISLTNANSKLYLWNANTGFEGLTFINPLSLFLTSETVLLLVIATLLIVLGFKWPIIWLFASLTGWLGAFFVYRDIQSIVIPMILFAIFVLVIFMFMIKAFGNKLGFDD